MTTSTDVQSAAADPSEPPSAALARERADWTGRRSAMQQRVTAIAAELEDLAASLAQARREAVLGEERDQAIAGLLGRQRALEAERDELATRIALAIEGEQEVHARFLKVRDVENAERAVERARALAERARASDGAIDTAIRELRQLLRDRAQIDEEIRAVQVQRIPLADAAVAGATFDLSRLPIVDEPDPGPRLRLPRI